MTALNQEILDDFFSSFDKLNEQVKYALKLYASDKISRDDYCKMQLDLYQTRCKLFSNLHL